MLDKFSFITCPYSNFETVLNQSYFLLKFITKLLFSAFSTIKDSFNQLIIKLSDKELTKLAHQPKYMIKSCMFGFSIPVACQQLMNGSAVKSFSPSAGKTD